MGLIIDVLFNVFNVFNDFCLTFLYIYDKNGASEGPNGQMQCL